MQDNDLPDAPACWVPRERLIRRLHAGTSRRLTLVVAPTGYGKTTLLLQFARQVPFPVRWLALEQADAELAHFVTRLIDSLHCAFPAFGQLTERFLDKYPIASVSPVTLGHALGHDLQAHTPGRFVLVLDNYHLVDDELAINGLLHALLLHGPRHCHTVIASRTSPAGLPVIRLVARSAVAGLGAADLAFTANELQELLSCAHHIRLPDAQAEMLVDASGGWIGGILLAMQSMWQAVHESLLQMKARRVGEQLGYPRALTPEVLDRDDLAELVAASIDSSGASVQQGRPEVILQALVSLGIGVRSGREQPAIGEPSGNRGSVEIHWRVGELILDRARRRVVCEDVPIPLSPLEFDLLAYLTQHRRVVSYEELLTHVWRCAADSGTPQLVRMAVSRLRAKLGQGGCCYPGIENVRGIGYRLSSHPGRN